MRAYIPVAAAALSLALAAPALAANTVGSADIVDGSIQSVDIGDGQVGLADVGNNAITTTKIYDGQVLTSDIGDGQVTSLDLANSGVQGIDILDGTITALDILNGTITLGKMAANSVDGSKVVDGSISAADLGTDSVGWDEIAANAISGIQVQNYSLDERDFAPGAVANSLENEASGVRQTGKIDVYETRTVGGTISSHQQFRSRLPSPLNAGHIVNPGATTAGCTGSYDNPTAGYGVLCVYLKSGDAGQFGFRRWDQRGFLFVIDPKQFGSTYAYDVEATWATSN